MLHAICEDHKFLLDHPTQSKTISFMSQKDSKGVETMFQTALAVYMSDDPVDCLYRSLNSGFFGTLTGRSILATGTTRRLSYPSSPAGPRHAAAPSLWRSLPSFTEAFSSHGLRIRTRSWACTMPCSRCLMGRACYFPMASQKRSKTSAPSTTITCDLHPQHRRYRWQANRCQAPPVRRGLSALQSGSLFPDDAGLKNALRAKGTHSLHHVTMVTRAG